MKATMLSTENVLTPGEGRWTSQPGRNQAIEEIVDVWCRHHLHWYNLSHESQALLQFASLFMALLGLFLPSPVAILWVIVLFAVTMVVHAICCFLGDAIAGDRQFVRGDLLRQMEGQMLPMDLKVWRLYFSKCTGQGLPMTIGQLRQFAEAERQARFNRETLIAQRHIAEDVL